MSNIQPTPRGPKSPASSVAGPTGIEPSRIGAAGSRAAGVLLYAVAFVGVFLGAQAGGLPGLVVSFLLALVLVGVAARLFIQAKRQAAPNAQTLLASDRRPPVMYLRSFTADPTTAKGVTYSSWFTEEEQLVRVMQDVGPLVAIGEPGELLPSLGATRLYVGTDDWQQVVQGLLARARLVMLRIGQSPGLYWEFENVVRRARPEQVVLLVPQDERVYEEFRIQAQGLLPRPLPILSHTGHRQFFRGSLRAVISFGPDWTATLVDLQTISLPTLRRSPAYPLVPVLQVALGPVMAGLGLPWRPPRYSLRMIMTIFLLLVMVFCLVLAFL